MNRERLIGKLYAVTSEDQSVFHRTLGLDKLLGAFQWSQTGGKILQRLLGEITVRIFSKQGTIEGAMLERVKDFARLFKFLGRIRICLCFFRKEKGEDAPDDFRGRPCI